MPTWRESEPRVVAISKPTRVAESGKSFLGLMFRTRRVYNPKQTSRKSELDGDRIRDGRRTSCTFSPLRCRTDNYRAQGHTGGDGYRPSTVRQDYTGA